MKVFEINGFQDTPIGEFPKDWDIVGIGDLFSLKQGKSLSQKFRFGDNPKPFLRTSNIFWNKVDLTSLDEMNFTHKEEAELQLQPSDLLVCEGGDIGRTAIWEGQLEKCYYQNHLHRLRRIQDDIYPQFYAFWMQAALLLLNLYGGEGNKTTIPNLSQGRLKSFLVPKPSFEEQRAIAHVLTTVRQAIEATDKVIEAARQLKRSMMQYLFKYGPVSLSEAEHVQLKETEVGEIPKKWQVVPVGNICKSIVPGRDKPKQFDGSIPWITISEIRGKNYVESSSLGLALSVETIKEVRGKIIPKNSVIMSCVGEFGFTAVTKNDIVINQQLHAFICPENLEPYFLIHALRLQKPFMKKIAHFTTLAYMSKDKCNSIPIPLPPIGDQRIISNYLIEIDRKIISEEQKKSSLESLFNSLLNHLLTGKIRVQI